VAKNRARLSSEMGAAPFSFLPTVLTLGEDMKFLTS
jgi:hypothetical protein